MSAPVLQINDLTVRLPTGADRENAIENVCLQVEPGETLCLVGESTSGKSVTAHAVMGLLPGNNWCPWRVKCCSKKKIYSKPRPSVCATCGASAWPWFSRNP